MKKIAITLLAFAALPLCLLAQEANKEKIEKEEIIEKREKPEKKEKAEKKESQEIIIRQNGDKEIKLKVEVDGDKITINGKPLSEFKDKDITINKRKMTITDGNETMNFDFAPGAGGFEKFGENFGEDFMRKFKTEDEETSKGAFFGVTTESTDGGVKVVEVVKGSAAEKAGLKKDDIIAKVGDEKITSPEVLSDVIGLKKAKDEIKVAYKRNGKENTVKATLGNRKQKRTMAYSFNSPDGNMRSFTLPKLAPMPNTNMEGFNEDMLEMQQDAMENAFPRQKKIGLKIQDTEDGGGVKVINVEDSSAAAIAGIKKDDIIKEINGKKIDNTDDAREELVPDEDKKLYKIKINRAGSEMNFDVKIPRKLKTANL